MTNPWQACAVMHSTIDSEQTQDNVQTHFIFSKNNSLTLKPRETSLVLHLATLRNVHFQLGSVVRTDRYAFNLAHYQQTIYELAKNHVFVV
eukprot:m.176618 g.176618  ORF g.176618 m.176618 type:complete len:91 (-) comp16802_c0_seq1:485-757(-)